MDFTAVILFLINYYLKPQEWTGLLSKMHPVQISIFLGIFALLRREKAVRKSDLFQTPHDWAILIFFSWIILTAHNPFVAFNGVINLVVFYVVIVQTLNTVRRIHIFLCWWCGLILVIALLAVLSEYGFDPLETYMMTHEVMKDRLCLNLSIFNNPNALAHSVVPVIPMLYFMMFWKRNVVLRLTAASIIGLPLYCIYLTVSKGAFLCGFTAVFAMLGFGRPKSFQIALLVFGVGFGYGALYMLPRMNELNKSKSDPAIQGRVAVYTYGYKCVTERWTGLGYGKWYPNFSRDNTRTIRIHGKMVREHYAKATHGSFNHMGSEFGFIGLMFFWGIVWCSMRTLMLCNSANPEEERIRRVLFVLTITYLTSSWMVDFGLRPTFFMFTAATAAFHRHLYGLWRQRDQELAAELVESANKFPSWHHPSLALERGPISALPMATPALEPAVGAIVIGATGLPTEPTSERPSEVPLKIRPLQSFEKNAPEEAPQDGHIDWNRFGLIDWLMPLLLTLATVMFWKHIIHSM